MTYDSRTAPKFVLRYASPYQRYAVQAAADVLHISDNSWIQQAIDEKLTRGRALDRVLSLAAAELACRPMYSEMVAALEQFIADCDHVNHEYSDLHVAADMARAVIAKARGVI